MVRATRAKCEPLRRRTAIAPASLCSVCETLHKDAVKSTVRRRSGLQIARVARAMRAPKTGVRL
eukprot:1110907-Lingulodinium_polyedra.AAC.1